MIYLNSSYGSEILIEFSTGDTGALFEGREKPLIGVKVIADRDNEFLVIKNLIKSL